MKAVHDRSRRDLVTLDGTTGEIWLGCDPAETSASTVDESAILAANLPELAILESWSESL